MAEIISIRFKREGKQYYFDPCGITINPGMGVVVETSWGTEFGECVLGNKEVAETSLVAPLRPVIRIATKDDLAVVERNQKKEKEAFGICQKKILDHALDMKLVDVEYSFEGNKILFFFTSEGRVDFRALVKDLAAIFHNRIELRQIGVRDEAKMLGGLGICGRPFCCSSFLREFQPVSIKMAKTQSLSLNPVKISGTCGRLMCCLKYEQEAYEHLLKSSPKNDSFVETPDGVGDIVSVNLLREKVRVRLDNAPDTMSIYHKSEIRVIRSGKGKRPDDYRAPSPEVLEKLRRVKEEVVEESRKPDSVFNQAMKMVTPSLRDSHFKSPGVPEEDMRPKSQQEKPAQGRQEEHKGEEKRPNRRQNFHGSQQNPRHRGDKAPVKPKKEAIPQGDVAVHKAPQKPKTGPEKPFSDKPAKDGEKKGRRQYWRNKAPGQRNRKPKEGGKES